MSETPFADLTDVTLADEDTNPILTDNANRTFQGNLATRVTQPGGQIWNQAMQVTWSDDQILNRFATNQKMLIHKKYKTDFKKYCKSDVEKCKSVSIEIKRSDRADLVDMCPDFDIFLENDLLLLAKIISKLIQV